MKTPELDRIAKVKDQSEIIGQFLDWLQDDRHYFIAEERVNHCHVGECYDANGFTVCGLFKGDDRLYPIRLSIEALLAEYYDIDLDKAEAEKRQILDEIRRQHGKA